MSIIFTYVGYFNFVSLNIGSMLNYYFQQPTFDQKCLLKQF